MTKEIHFSQLHNPHVIPSNEHYCRRWISIWLIKQLRSQQAVLQSPKTVVGAQISRYWNTSNAYFCIALTKPTRDDTNNSSSVTLGLLMNEKLINTFPFLAQQAVHTQDVHTSCERCAISDCTQRVAPPAVLQQDQLKQSIHYALKQLKKQA